MTKRKRTKQPAQTPTAQNTELASARSDVRIVFNEMGTSGLKTFSGFINEAYNTVLTWPSCAPLYSRLRRSMPEIAVVRNAFTSWGRSVELEVDMPDEPSDDDKRYKDFVMEVFDDMEGGQTKFIDTLVNYVPFYGWGWWEVVAGRRDENWTPPGGDDWRSQYDDDMIGLRRLAFRSPSTFQSWEFDDRKNLLGMVQQDYPNKRVTLPLKDSLHLTYGDPNNPEGLSPLEAVYRLERIRYGYEVVMGIGFEHSAGFVSMKKTQQGELSESDKSVAKAAAKAILTAQEGNYALSPFGIDLTVEDIGFTAAPALLETIRHYSTLVLACFTMQWIALNTMTGTGSYAAADDSSSLGVFTFNAMLDGFAEQFDEQVGKRLYAWNKEAFPDLTKRPKIRFSHINKQVALADMSSFISQLNGIIPLGIDDYIAIRKRSGFLPEASPEVSTEPANQPLEANPTMDETTAEAGDVTDAALSIIRQSLNATSHDFTRQRKLK